LELTKYLNPPPDVKVDPDVQRWTARVLAHEAADRMREAHESVGGILS
jgi:hypothetical protein